MEARKESDMECSSTFIINELSTMHSEQAQKILASYWETESYRELKQKLIEHPETLSPDELISFVLTRDGGEAPYEIPLERLKKVIEEKKSVLPASTLNHLIIIQKMMAQDDIIDNELGLTIEFLNMLFAREDNYPNTFLNLAKANLANMDLFGASLTGAYLVRANLSNARIGYRFHGANMSYANLTGAQFPSAFENVNLTGSNLTQANMLGCRLNNINLSYANLSNADLTMTTLNHVNMHKATLNETIFCSTKYEGSAFLSTTVSLSQLKSELIPLLLATMNCETNRRLAHEKISPTYINEKEFDDKLYRAIVTEVVMKLDAMTEVNAEKKVAFLNEIYPFFQPKSKAVDSDIALAVLSDNLDLFFTSTINKDIGFARFFGMVKNETKSQKILSEAKLRIAGKTKDMEQSPEAMDCRMQ